MLCLGVTYVYQSTMTLANLNFCMLPQVILIIPFVLLHKIHNGERNTACNEKDLGVYKEKDSASLSVSI